MSVWAIVAAGGQGSRFGRLKQFEVLAGRRVLDRSVEAARSAADGVVVVLPGDLFSGAQAAVVSVPGASAVVPGGSTRSASVRAGLAALPEEATVVVVHDAARPLASPALFAAVVEALADPVLDGAIPVQAVTETVKRLEGGRVAQTLPRDHLALVQTPQAFRRPVLEAAHAGQPDGPDDASLVEAIGGLVGTVAGEDTNLKLTTPADLALAEWYVAGRLAPAHRPASRCGTGFDVHRFSADPSRPLLLGGIRFEGERGLDGHSDGDVVCHAIADALLGAAGLGDIGQHFSDQSDEWAGADSLEILAKVAGMVKQAGWVLANADCSVVLEAPRLAPYRQAMVQRLGDALGGPVNVKAKRAEGLGSLGRAEGIACWATALLERLV